MPRIRQRMRRGQAARGGWLFLGSPAVTEVLADTPVDALIIDLEHTCASLDTALMQLRAAGTRGPDVLARVDAAGSPLIKPLLDAGVQGILAPNVESAEQAAQLVAACHYPPLGRRGLHYTVSRAARWGACGEAYAAGAREHTLVVAMIESAAGVAAIPELAQVPGLDMLFIGPLDLSASIGQPGDYGCAAFRELWHEAERRCLEHGLALGGTVLPGHGFDALAARGYAFVTLGSDVGLLRQAAMAQFAGGD
ncbi:HpcH/HpaI aldolase family protein [Frateuria defendens]|uniref:HpcH/HpaI aldolase family protein n=1 Tax=Frateuria defendens TaxID=2219559 RepID=UPI0007DC02A3|nr:aldolase/citrate lyase family protein [Frateuria defendens]